MTNSMKFNFFSHKNSTQKKKETEENEREKYVKEKTEMPDELKHECN